MEAPSWVVEVEEWAWEEVGRTGESGHLEKVKQTCSGVSRGSASSGSFLLN